MSDETRAGVRAEARAVCDIVRTTLGPYGASKLVIEKGGRVTCTSSGSTVLERIDIDNPTLTLLKAAGRDFRESQGDGSTTVVVVVGALVEAADRLSEMGVEPTVIERGYRRALDIALETVDARSIPLSEVGAAAVARTALTGTRDPGARATVADYLTQVVDAIRERHGSIAEFDADQIAVLSRIGGAQAQTELVGGVVLDKEPAAEGMPRRIEDAGIALLSSTVDVPKFGGVTDRMTVQLSMAPASFEERAAIGEREREDFEASLERVVADGCSVILTEGAVNDRVKTAIANRGIFALQRVEYEDLQRIARTTGAAIVPDLDHLTPAALGRGTVAVNRHAGRDLTYVEGSTDEVVYTLFCRAPDPRSADTFERSVEGALASVLSASNSETVVPGGGAIEMSCAHAIRDRAREIEGREQLAVEAFGDALRVVPRTLATNGGLDGWTALVRLHVAHAERRHATGVDSVLGELGDVLEGESPLADPAVLKREVLTAATELAGKFVRIDDRLAATDLSPEEKRYDDDGKLMKHAEEPR